MNSIRTRTDFALLIALMVFCLLPFGCSQKGGTEKPPEEGGSPRPTVTVKVASIKQGAIDETIRVYGTVIPAPGAITTVSVPFESRISRIMVSEGQEVADNDLLIELGPSPDTHLKFNQALEAYDAAKQGLANVERRFELKLATNDQVLQARQTFEEARLSLESMKEQGIDGARVIRATTKGLVSKIAVNQGAIATAGGPLMQIVPEARLELRLGVEPEDIGKIRPGMEVSVSRVSVRRAPAVTGTVRQMSRSVNPETRLVDVFVAIPSPSVFLLGQYVSGRIAVASVEGLIVPRNSVLPSGKAHVVFVVKDDKALKRTVRLLAENQTEACIAGAEIRAGDRVVISGNYELEDNMRVAVQGSR
jgi:membrane fusion protein (multidrug efflux system)